MADRPEIDLDRPETWPAAAREYLERRRPSVDTRLRDAVRAEIQARGPLTFARFMELALYHPEWGYYAVAAHRVGPAGDFVTAPTTHPAFGALLARRIAALWERAGRPDPFAVAEAGAGTGALAAQILSAVNRGNRTDKAQHGDTETRRATDGGEGVMGVIRAGSPPHLPHPPTLSLSSVSPCLRVEPLSDGIWSALRYCIIEPYPVWQRAQARTLAPWAGRISWYADLEAQPGPPQLMLANELLDALPVHRVVRRARGLRELYVAMDEAGRLTEREGPLSTEALNGYFRRAGVRPPVGTPVEVSLAAVTWLRRALAARAGGWVWLLDYGAEAGELYSAPRAGTLRAFQGHALSTDPLVRVGTQDLTADVDFTTVMRTAEEAGWVVDEYTTQRELLLSLGLEEWLRPPDLQPDPDAGGAPAGRWALLQLIDPGGMGAIRSLLLRDAAQGRVSAASTAWADPVG